MTDELFEIIKIQNNIKNHDFDVSNLKITKRESEVILMCLETQKNLLDFEGVKLQFEIPKNCEMKKVVISGAYHNDKTFPSLNNLLADYARAPQIGGSTKRKYKDICSWEIRSQLRGYKAEMPLILHYRFFEPSRGQKRDLPNIMTFFDKCFEDALQDCGVIPKDNPTWMKNITHDFFYTDGEPYVEVYIEELKDDEMPVL